MIRFSLGLLSMKIESVFLQKLLTYLKEKEDKKNGLGSVTSYFRNLANSSPILAPHPNAILCYRSTESITIYNQIVFFLALLYLIIHDKMRLRDHMVYRLLPSFIARKPLRERNLRTSSKSTTGKDK